MSKESAPADPVVFTPDELRLLGDQAFFRAKAQIMKKMKAILEGVYRLRGPFNRLTLLLLRRLVLTWDRQALHSPGQCFLLAAYRLRAPRPGRIDGFLGLLLFQILPERFLEACQLPNSLAWLTGAINRLIEFLCQALQFVAVSMLKS